MTARDCWCDSSLLPLWEKVARTQSAPDEGSLSAETDPSPVRGASHRVHPLPQGERGRGRLLSRDMMVHDRSINPIESRAPMSLQVYFAFVAACVALALLPGP